MAIAAERSTRDKPIQIRADILNRSDTLAPYLDRLGVPPVIDDAPPPACDGEAPSADEWRDEDLKRAIAVAEEAGLTSYRIEIAPDGAITIFVGGLSQDSE